MKPGYVYILKPKTFKNLPLCKIGMTERTPEKRCHEINRSSNTGDLLWEVAYAVYTDNCHQSERLVHASLLQHRQTGREFFNITADAAQARVQDVIENDTTVSILDTPPIAGTIPPKQRLSPGALEGKHDSMQRLYHCFRDSLNLTQLRPFGQIGKGKIGVSDNARGVQWNLCLDDNRGDILLGVNLEGMKYDGWPISRFIQFELDNPSIERLQSNLTFADMIEINAKRDAWQVSGRLSIAQRTLCHSGMTLDCWTNTLWKETLLEAWDCLSVNNGVVGRAEQNVTVIRKTADPYDTRKPVTPHFTIQTVVARLAKAYDVDKHMLKAAIERLSSVHQWMKSKSMP